VIRTFWFITTRSFRNRIVSRTKRLREPRYLIGFIAGLAYLWFTWLRRAFVLHQGTIVRGYHFPINSFTVDLIATLALVPIIIVWAAPDSGGGLTFSEAEIQFLFAGPVSRRQLLIYKVLRQQPQVLISALAMTIFGFGASKFFGVWAAFITLSTYFTVVPLARARLRLAGIGFLLRLAAVIGVFALLGAVFYHEMKPLFDPSHIATYGDVETLIRSGHSPFATPVLRTILFVPRVFASAAAPQSLLQLLISCVALAVMAVLFVAIAGQLNVSFEDASLRASAKQQNQVERVRSFRAGNRVLMPRLPPPFRLPANPVPELAILWKNLIAAMRMSIAWVIVIGALFALLCVQAFATHEPVLHATTGAIALFMAGFFPFLASTILTQDMRLDLPRIEILKSYPIRGERLVAAEIAAPLVIMSIVELLLLAGTAVLLQLPSESAKLKQVATAENVVAALLFAIPICAMQLLIRNAVAVLFPGWAVRTADDQRGFAVVGQRLVLLASNLLVLAATLVPAAIVFGIAFVLSHHLFPGSVPVLAVATVPAVAVIAAEFWLGVKFLGSQFEKVDVTNEMV
jgi:ABC-2 type transport system permease protein